MTNVLQAIATIINNPIPDLINYYKSQSNNRINALGEALEYFVKDAFANTIHEPDISNKLDKYSQLFSWSGNQNNPPDLIIRNGDAVEVKKIEVSSNQIPLNSSYPKSKIFSNSPQITSACRTCENWIEKDILYVIGATSAGTTRQKLKKLWLVYGDCYAASKEYYERIRNQIATGINAIPDVEFSNTRELGRVNKVDPLGITYLRIRGMWGIESPARVYNYINTGYDLNANFQMIAIMTESKYLSFPDEDRIMIESISDQGFRVNTQRIKSPDNPAILISAKIITYTC
jgi:NgoPII restriction endonuclease